MTDDFMDALAVARRRAGLSMFRLAERADLDHSMVSRLENGKRHPSRAAVTRLVAAMALMADEEGRQLAVKLYIAAGFIPAGFKITAMEWVGLEQNRA